MVCVCTYVCVERALPGQGGGEEGEGLRVGSAPGLFPPTNHRFDCRAPGACRAQPMGAAGHCVDAALTFSMSWIRI